MAAEDDQHTEVEETEETEDDDIFDEEDESEEDDDSKSESEDDDDDDIESLRTARKELKAALAKANKDAAKHRGENAELKKKYGTATDKQIEEAQNKAREEEKGRYKPGLVRTAARVAFSDLGLRVSGKDDAERDKQYNRVIRLLDQDKIDIDDDGSVIGLSDQVKQIKRDYPELFGTNGSSSRSIDAAGRRQPSTQKASSTERLAASLTGRGGDDD